MIKKKVKKLTYKQWTDRVIDNSYDIFDDTSKKDHAAVGISLMAQAMAQLYMSGYCQHQVGEMAINALEQFIEMENDFAKDEKREAFPKEDCNCELHPIYESVKPLSKLFN